MIERMFTMREGFGTAMVENALSLRLIPVALDTAPEIESRLSWFAKRNSQETRMTTIATTLIQKDFSLKNTLFFTLIIPSQPSPMG